MAQKITQQKTNYEQQGPVGGAGGTASSLGTWTKEASQRTGATEIAGNGSIMMDNYLRNVSLDSDTLASLEYMLDDPAFDDVHGPLSSEVEAVQQTSTSSQHEQVAKELIATTLMVRGTAQDCVAAYVRTCTQLLSLQLPSVQLDSVRHVLMSTVNECPERRYVARGFALCRVMCTLLLAPHSSSLL